MSTLLSAYPQAPVAALSTAGIFVEMPQSLTQSMNLKQNPALPGRAGLDGVDGETRARLLKNWDRILTIGAGRCVFQPPGYDQEVTLFGLDLRDAHGVIVTMLVGRDAAARRRAEAESPVSAPPRLATVRKTELSIIAKIDDALSEILGWSAEEMQGQRSLEFVHPDDHALAIDNWMQMLARPGPARRIRQRLRRKDGSWTWFEATNHNLLDDPEHGCVVCEMVDISDEMATHEALRAQRAAAAPARRGRARRPGSDRRARTSRVHQRPPARDLRHRPRRDDRRAADVGRRGRSPGARRGDREPCWATARPPTSRSPCACRPASELGLLHDRSARADARGRHRQRRHRLRHRRHRRHAHA